MVVIETHSIVESESYFIFSEKEGYFSYSITNNEKSTFVFKGLMVYKKGDAIDFSTSTEAATIFKKMGCKHLAPDAKVGVLIIEKKTEMIVY